MAKTKKEKAPKQGVKPVVIETPAQRLSGIIKTCRNIMRKDKGMNGDGDRLPMLTWIMFLKFLDDNEQLQEINAQLEKNVWLRVSISHNRRQVEHCGSLNRSVPVGTLRACWILQAKSFTPASLKWCVEALFCFAKNGSKQFLPL